MGSLASILGIFNKGLQVVNQLLDFWETERWKQVGMNEQRLANLEKLEKLRKAADHARKNPATGNLFDAF